MNEKKIIGIDIGGTMVKYALLTLKGKILQKGEFPTEASKGVENLFKNISNVINVYLEENILGIAVSGTGQIDGTIGKVIGGNPIIPGWIGTDLVKKLEEKFNLPAILENDVNCAALGEKWIGAGKDSSNFICITIGTGVGGGIILNNKIFTGESFVAGEFGHMQIVKDGISCSCGKRGCFEKYASTTALVNMVQDECELTLNGKEIFQRYHEGDIKIIEIVDAWIDYITDGLSNIAYIFNPNLLVLGGGVTKQGDFLLNKIKVSLGAKLGINFKKNLNIKFATLGNDAGLIGASYLLLKKTNEI